MINFRKIASVLASTVMIGSTVAMAAAANFPAPYVQSGNADVAIVYGAQASVDLVAVLDVQGKLSDTLSAQTASSGDSGASVSGEAKAIETSGQKLYLGDYMNGTKEAFTSSELPNVLADGTVTDTDGTAFDFTQKILVPNTYVGYGRTSDNLADPVLFANFEDSSKYYEEQVIFPTAVNVTKLADKDITLFGKKFSFSGSSADLTSTKVVLYESSNTQLINEGETVTINVGGTDHTIENYAVESATQGTIIVDGQSQSVTETNSYKVAGLDFYVKNVIGSSVAGSPRAIELTLGSAKLTLENGNDVVKGAETVYGARTTITQSGGKVSKIAIRVTPYSLDDRVKYLQMGESMTEPVFGAFKIELGSYAPAVDDSSRDYVLIKSSGENKASMKWTNKAGGAYDMDMFEPSTIGLNASKVWNFTAATTYNATTLGFDTYNVVTSTSAHIAENDYFITNNNEYSQIFRVDRIDTTNKKVRVRDQASGTSAQEISLNDSHTGSVASLSLADGSTATVTLTGNGTTAGTLNVTVSKASPTLYTLGGAKIDLQYIADPATYNQTSHSKIVISEETSYNGGDFKNNNAATLGSQVNVTLLYNVAGKTGNDVFVDALTVGGLVSGDSGSSVGDYDKYYLTTYGTFVKQTGSDDKQVNVYYPSSAASLGVFIGEESASIEAGSSSGGTVQSLGNVVVTDSEVSSVSSKNLIVVGGSCVNSVAASLLGGALCGADFTTETGVGAGQFLIETFSYGTDKVATLVAGYNAGDTVNAAKYFTTQPVDTTVGKKYVGTSATSAELVTTTA